MGWNAEGYWVVYGTLKIKWELWYQYVVGFYAGGDNIHWKQLFLRAKMHGVLHISVLG